MKPAERYQTEKKLIARVLKGDDAAFYELISDYRIRLYRKAFSLIGNADDAEDVLQESLLTAYRALDRFRGESGIYTWLFRILINKCRDRQRGKASRREDSIDAFIPMIQDDRITIEKKFELSEDAAYLMGKINSLEKKYREILLLRYYDDLSYQEIAEIVHANIGTVKSRLFKARELMKRAVMEDGRGGDYFETGK